MFYVFSSFQGKRLKLLSTVIIHTSHTCCRLKFCWSVYLNFGQVLKNNFFVNADICSVQLSTRRQITQSTNSSIIKTNQTGFGPLSISTTRYSGNLKDTGYYFLWDVNVTGQRSSRLLFGSSSRPVTV